MTRIRIAAGLLAVVTLSAACSTAASPTAPTPNDPSGPLFYTAIGASDGIGFGSSVPCLPFAECANGTGYVQILLQQLRSGGRTVGHLNASLPGGVLSRAIEELAASIGREISPLASNFIDRQVPFVPAETTHITIFAGGNDANVIAQAARAGRGGNDLNSYVDAQVRQWGTDLEALVAGLKAKAPNARIVALNLPNLAGSPYVATNPIAERSIMQRVAVGLSDHMNSLTGRGVLLVDLMCDARLYLPSNYAADGFHPSDGGYAVFAELALPVMRDGVNNQPSTACAQRRIVP